MKYCSHCGNEISECAAICIKCGCEVENNKNKTDYYAEKRISSALILGIIGCITAWIFALVGHITSIIGIVKGIKEYNETEQMSGLVFSIIGEICSILSSAMGVMAVSDIILQYAC